jgi:hypothetical protein
LNGHRSKVHLLTVKKRSIVALLWYRGGKTVEKGRVHQKIKPRVELKHFGTSFFPAAPAAKYLVSFLWLSPAFCRSRTTVGTAAGRS